LPTQAVADFLATANDPRLDGIIFPSVQVEQGYNVVLFHEAARVAKDTIPEGTEIEASTGHNSEDGWEVDYCVTEVVPPPEVPKADHKGGHILETFQDFDDDYRSETLHVAIDSVEVHRVTWVKVSTSSHSVQRYRREKRPAEY
jgi:hypothetical protein